MERFYSKVNAIVHNRNLLKDSIIVEEKAEAEQYKKALRMRYCYSGIYSGMRYCYQRPIQEDYESLLQESLVR